MDKEADFVKVANTKDVPPCQMKEFQVNRESVCIANVDGKYYAINNICTHEGGPLADGVLEGYEVECPWHQSRFDVRTGEVKSPPAGDPEPTYEVKVDRETLLIRKRIGSQQFQNQRSSEYNLILLVKQKYEDTDVMCFKLSRKEQNGDVDQNNKSTLDYKAGQFAFFDIGGVHNDAKGPIRHFTLASSPTEDFTLICTRIRDSPYKKRLASLDVGIKVKVRGPEGKFVLHEDYTKPAVFLSGGIGVTPFRSMIMYATDKQLPLRIVMFDSNRNEQNILFKTEFDECANRNKNLRIIYTITEEEQGVAGEWKGEKGKIDKAMLTRYMSTNELDNSVFYICGPPAMLKAMQNMLRDFQIPDERIKTEEFTGY